MTDLTAEQLKAKEQQQLQLQQEQRRFLLAQKAERDGGVPLGSAAAAAAIARGQRAAGATPA